MGGFCGVVSKEDCVSDLFFGTDYHSHLGTHRGGLAVLKPDGTFRRSIHNIQNAPFRSKFEHDLGSFSGPVGIGNGSYDRVALHLMKNIFEFCSEWRILDIMDLALEAFALLVEGCQAASSRSQMGMIVSSEKHVGQRVIF